MKRYFEKQIGELLVKSFKTGNSFFTEVYQRTFSIEVITVSATTIQARVSSEDYVPSGFRQGGSERNYNSQMFSFKNDEMLDMILERICKTVDPEFFERYTSFK
jgi:hypothetical protein